MSVLVAVSKRRAKRLAGGIIRHDETLGWQLILYMIANGQLGPFGLSPFATREEAIADANDSMKTKDADWVEVHEDDAEQYILDHAKNQWSVPG